MLAQCWATILGGGPTLNKHWVNASCLMLQDIPTAVHYLYSVTETQPSAKQPRSFKYVNRFVTFIGIIQSKGLLSDCTKQSKKGLFRNSKSYVRHT